MSPCHPFYFNRRLSGVPDAMNPRIPANLGQDRRHFAVSAKLVESDYAAQF